MAVSAVIKLEQISGPQSESSVRSFKLGSFQGTVREDTFERTGRSIINHLPQIINPESRPGARGWPTEFKDDWSDSPTRQPDLLYRYRFAFGRDRRERFDNGYVDGPLSEGDDGARWGNLDDNSGVLVYERTYPLSSTGTIRQFRVHNSARISNILTSISSENRIYHLPKISAEQTLELFPFIVNALPEPFSYRNPIDTDVFIRLSNYTFPLASGTITLYLDDVLKTPIQISEFFGGLGGFDALWANDELFEYDATVNVRWEVYDTDTPPNKIVIAYQFYTVPDLAPPRALNLVPDDFAIGVPVKGPIQFDLEDFENDVDISTLVLYVNNSKVIDGVNGQLVVTEKENGGYTIQFTPEDSWLYGDLIPVAIFVRDTSKHQNELFFSYSFTTEESLAPRLINPDPAPCTVSVPTNTNIQVDVIDGGHGLDKDSIVLTVEEIERGGTVLLIPIIHRDE